MDKKFKFIELPRPEITLPPEGEASLFGGEICYQYTQCINNKDITCEVWIDTSDCAGNPIGCEGGLFCEIHALCNNYYAKH